MKRTRLLKKIVLLLLILQLASFTGCGSRIILHPIDQQDIIRVKNGEPFESDRDGWFLSDMYMTDVLEVSVE